MRDSRLLAHPKCDLIWLREQATREPPGMNLEISRREANRAVWPGHWFSWNQLCRSIGYFTSVEKGLKPYR